MAKGAARCHGPVPTGKSAERKLLDSAVIWDFWRVDMPRNFPGLVVVPFPTLAISNTIPAEVCHFLPYDYIISGFDTKGLVWEIWGQIPSCYILGMRSQTDYLTLWSLFFSSENKSRVIKCGASRFVIVHRQSSSHSSIFKYAIDYVLDVENTDRIKHSPLKNSRSVGETPRHSGTCQQGSLCWQG